MGKRSQPTYTRYWLFEAANVDLGTVDASCQTGGHNYIWFPKGIPLPNGRPPRRGLPVFALKLTYYVSFKMDGFADARAHRWRFYKWLTPSQARSFRKGNYRAKPTCFR